MKKADLRSAIGEYSKENNVVIDLGQGSFEISSFFIDSYGDTVYCFVEPEGPYFKVSDDGRLLFKLDPGLEDQEFYQTAKEVIIGAGFDFDEETATISFITDQENLAQVIIKLAQLQVAVSYLG